MLNKKVLVIGLEREIFYSIKESIEELGINFELINVPLAKEAWEHLRGIKPVMAVMSNELPAKDDYLNFCQELRQKAEGLETIVIAVKDEPQKKKLEVLKSGIVADYIMMPLPAEEIGIRINMHLKIKLLQDELKNKTVLLRKASITDALTGIYNRRYMDGRIEEEIMRTKRYRCPLSCLMIDIDHFKQANDRHGHKAGDKVLQELGRLLKQDLRATDIAGRWGGEEFLVLLPHTPVEGAVVCAERIREVVAGTKVEHLPRQVTVSIGAAGFILNENVDSDDLVNEADKAMYMAKKSGRNKVCWLEISSENIKMKSKDAPCKEQ